MIYSVEAAPPGGTEYEWQPLSDTPLTTRIRAIRVMDKDGNRIALDVLPTVVRVAFWRDFVRLLHIHQAALAWRNAVQYTDGIQKAENALMAAVEGKTLKEGYR